MHPQMQHPIVPYSTATLLLFAVMMTVSSHPCQPPGHPGDPVTLVSRSEKRVTCTLYTISRILCFLHLISNLYKCDGGEDEILVPNKVLAGRCLRCYTASADTVWVGPACITRAGSTYWSRWIKSISGRLDQPESG